MTLRILAVEDDIIQARLVRHLVRQAGYALVGIAASATEAEAMFTELMPDLVVLDIHLRGPRNGIELARSLMQRQRVPIIFLTTDHDRHTFEQALTVGPSAFLTKPYDEDHFLRALDVAVAQLALAHGGPTATLPDGSAMVPGAMYIRENNRLVKVHYADVTWIESDDSYIHLHTPTRKFTVKLSLREMATKLPADRFLRIGGSAIVQLARIEQVDLTQNVVYVQGSAISIGRSYRNELLQRLNRLG